MKLYDGGRAPNPRRVKVFLAEKGITVPTEQVDLGKLAHKSPAYTAINPLQRIDCGVCGRLVRQFAEIDLLGRYRNPLFRQEDLDPARIGRPAPVIKLHLSPFVNPGVLSRA